jgi:hypothetical protein
VSSIDPPVFPPIPLYIYISSTDLSVSLCVPGIFLGFSIHEILSVSSRFVPLNLLEISPDFTVSLLDLLHFSLYHGSLRTQPGSHSICSASFLPSLYCSRISLHSSAGSSIPDHPCISLGFPVQLSWISYPCDFFHFV